MLDLLDATEIESLLEETGGVPVEIYGVSTFGHQELADEELLELRKAGGAKDGVVVATEILPQTPEDGVPLTVDGTSAIVVGHRRVSDGKLLAIGFGDWSHEVAIYRPTTSSGSRGQQEPGWEQIAARAGIEIRARRGEIETRDIGFEATGEWEGRIAPSVSIEPGYGLKLISGKGPERYEVTFVGDRTDNWRVPLVLEESKESFG